MKNYIGIDLGGTQVRVALVNELGEVLHDVVSPSYAMEGVEKVLENIFNLIDNLPEKETALAIGVGVPGPVVDGVMKISTNLKGFSNYPIAEKIKERYHLPVFVDNDANVAGLAEALVGAGKGLPIVYYYTHSTGIGGALVIDGKLISGKHGFAGEIANIIVEPNGTTHNALNPGAVENLASGKAIGLKAASLIKGVENSKDLFELARKNDPKALEIIDQMVEHLAIMMSSIAHVVDPDCFVIGGGVSKASDVYFEKLITSFKNKIHVAMRDVEVVKAKLKEPGVIGAAMLCVSHLNK